MLEPAPNCSSFIFHAVGTLNTLFTTATHNRLFNNTCFIPFLSVISEVKLKCTRPCEHLFIAISPGNLYTIFRLITWRTRPSQFPGMIIARYSSRFLISSYSKQTRQPTIRTDRQPTLIYYCSSKYTALDI